MTTEQPPPGATPGNVTRGVTLGWVPLLGVKLGPLLDPGVVCTSDLVGVPVVCTVTPRPEANPVLTAAWEETTDRVIQSRIADDAIIDSSSLPDIVVAGVVRAPPSLPPLQVPALMIVLDTTLMVTQASCVLPVKLRCFGRL